MALEIGKVNTRVEIQEEQKAQEAAGSSLGVRLNMTDSELRDKIRPLVSNILEEEMARFKRWQG